jgi:hypothetical protein
MTVETFFEKALKERAIYRKIRDFIYKPHVPQKLKEYYENWTFIKFK